MLSAICSTKGRASDDPLVEAHSRVAGPMYAPGGWAHMQVPHVQVPHLRRTAMPCHAAHSAQRQTRPESAPNTGQAGVDHSRLSVPAKFGTSPDRGMTAAQSNVQQNPPAPGPPTSAAQIVVGHVRLVAREGDLHDPAAATRVAASEQDLRVLLVCTAGPPVRGRVCSIPVRGLCRSCAALAAGRYTRKAQPQSMAFLDAVLDRRIRCT